MTGTPTTQTGEQGALGRRALEVSLDSGVIAILRAKDSGRFVEISDALVEAGITSLEYTLTSSGAIEALAAFASRLPDGVVLGAGSVLDVEAADAAVDAGASYLVSPHTSVDVIERAQERGVASFPGAVTPTEIVTAWRAGASAVKLFPASSLGPEYMKALRGPLPQIPLIPTGGVDADNAAAYVKAGAVALGVGGPLIGDAATGGDLGQLQDRARRLLQEVAAAREAAA